MIFPSQIPWRDKWGQMQRILGCGLLIHLAMRPLTRHINWKWNRKKKTNVYQTELDYLVYSITSQGLLDNTEHSCRNHSIIGNGVEVKACFIYPFSSVCDILDSTVNESRLLSKGLSSKLKVQICLIRMSSQISQAKPKSSVATEWVDPRQKIVIQG